jgi:hypothetical protein
MSILVLKVNNVCNGLYSHSFLFLKSPKVLNKNLNSPLVVEGHRSKVKKMPFLDLISIFDYSTGAYRRKLWNLVEALPL